MLNYSFSTVLMAVLTSNILIIIIASCFRNEKVVLSIGYKLLTVFLVFTLIRFIFPFELPFTRNILLPKPLSMVIYYIRHPFLKLGGVKISVWLLLEVVWICGAAVKLYQMIRSHLAFRRYVFRYGRNVTAKEPYSSALRKVCDSRKIGFCVILVPGLDTPRQLGCFHPCILIPYEMNLSEEEIYYTICHEIFHYRHGDFLIKLGINILEAFYWWNPLCHKLKDQVDMILEMEVDEKLVKGDLSVRKAYLDTLVNIADNALESQDKPRPALSPLTSPLAAGDIGDLSLRVQMLYPRKRLPVPLFLLLFTTVFLLYISSYCFTFEAHYLSDFFELETPEVQYDEMYAILLEDGSYDVYWGTYFVEHTDSLEHYTGIQIITKQ